MVKKKFNVSGMTCNSCTRLIEEVLDEVGVKANANYSKSTVEVNYNSKKISEKKIIKIIEKAGYEIIQDKENNSRSVGDKVGLWFMFGSIALLVYLLYGWVSQFNLSVPGVGDSAGLLLLFFVGILTGFHCISMCGAFVVAYTTKNAKNGNRGFSQHLVYGGSKLISYMVIGGIFGLIGGLISFSVGLRGAVSIFAGVFMVFYGLSMLGIGFFRRFQFNPKFLSRWTARATRHAKGAYKAPMVTGFLSGFFIACGPLQAMYLYAAGTGGFLSGVFSLGAFGLGTLPVMLGFGSLATVISHNTTKKILRVSAVIVLILGFIMLNRGLVVLGSPYTLESIVPGSGVDSASGNSAVIKGDYQEINMEVNRYGWEPDTFTLKKGVPVKWNIDVKELTGCNNEIIVRDYGLQFKLKAGLNVIEFTPDKVGTVRWSCWMGMIPGAFVVTDDGVASEDQLNEVAATAPSGGCGCGGGSTCGA